MFEPQQDALTAFNPFTHLQTAKNQNVTSDHRSSLLDEHNHIRKTWQ
jgi:hypothetical protein